MPTGYTATLMEKGQAFPDFVLLCARAMVATIMLRDEPLDAPIPEFQPSDYAAKRLEESKTELARLLAMTDEEKIAFGQSKKDAAIERNKKWIADQQAENARLIEMRDKVKAWQPPTSDHDGLKNFMLEQLEISMNSVDYYEREIIAAKQSFARDYYDKAFARDYYDKAVAEAQRGIEYNAEEDRKERERTDARNRWVRELRASLNANAPVLATADEKTPPTKNDVYEPTD
jgi:hypothetical protein